MRINEEIEILKPVSRFSLSANSRYGFRKYHKIGYLYKNTTLYTKPLPLCILHKLIYPFKILFNILDDAKSNL